MGKKPAATPYTEEPAENAIVCACCAQTMDPCQTYYRLNRAGDEPCAFIFCESCYSDFDEMETPGCDDDGDRQSEHRRGVL